MFLSKILNKVPPQRCLYPLFTHLTNKNYSRNSDDENSHTQNQKSSLGKMGTKYQVFRDQDAEVIYDIYEDRKKYESLLENDLEEEVEEADPLQGINLNRGLHGVYDIKDLVEVLRRENAEQIFVATIPKEIKYVDYICIVTGKSYKHMNAIAQFVRKVYKKKMQKNDLIPRLEGQSSKEWLALDLGNIALHIFSPQARILYDLETLWSVGPQFDTEYNKTDPVSEMLEKHSLYLHDLQPAQ